MKNKIALAREAIEQSQVLELLRPYTPEIVSTIFVELDTEESDIDVICCMTDMDEYRNHVNQYFGLKSKFSLSSRENICVFSFMQNNFLIEVYASPEAVRLQPAYCHYQVMRRLGEVGGESFKSKIRRLKSKGLKTEPAICELLGLEGDPYETVYRMYSYSTEALRDLVIRLSPGVNPDT